MPSPLSYTIIDIGRFLASSLVFMTNLKLVTVAFDSHVVLRFQKSIGSSRHMPLIRDLNPELEGMKAVEVDQTEVRISADVATWIDQIPSYDSSRPDSSMSPSSSFVSSEYKVLVWVRSSFSYTGQSTRTGIA